MQNYDFFVTNVNPDYLFLRLPIKVYSWYELENEIIKKLMIGNTLENKSWRVNHLFVNFKAYLTLKSDFPTGVFAFENDEEAQFLLAEFNGKPVLIYFRNGLVYLYKIETKPYQLEDGSEIMEFSPDNHLGNFYLV